MQVEVRKSKAHHVSNQLLENECMALADQLGPKCQSLSTSVVQLFLTRPPRHKQWKKHDTGVMCLVKDFRKRSYFFRMYCPSKQWAMTWECQVYNQLQYKTPQAWFHTFEADTCMAGLNFVDEIEAAHFRKAVLDRLEFLNQPAVKKIDTNNQYEVSPAKNKKKSSKKTAKQENKNVTVVQQEKTPETIKAVNTKKKKNGWLGSVSGRKKERPKLDISQPIDFVHVSHVGLDGRHGFEGHGEVLNHPVVQDFFANVGVSETQLQNRRTRNFIMDFVQTHGIDAIKQDVEQTASRKPTSRQPRPDRVKNKLSVYEESEEYFPETQSQNRRSRKVQIYRNDAIRRPPSLQPRPDRVVSKLSVYEESDDDFPETSLAVTPPVLPTYETTSDEGYFVPPPPPPPSIPAYMNNTEPEMDLADPRLALMASIKTGKTLKHVDKEGKAGGQDTRGELLDQIKRGKQLKRVEATQRPVAAIPKEGLAGVLARALEERKRAFHDSDSDSDSGKEEDSDSEWEE